MEKLFQLSYRRTLTIERFCDCLNDADIFGTYDGTSDCLYSEETEVFGTTVYSTTSEDNGEDASVDYYDEPMSVGSNIIFE